MSRQPLDPERFWILRGHNIYRYLVGRRRWDTGKATSYCVLRQHGMGAGEALAAIEEHGYLEARNTWRKLPAHRLNLYDRLFIEATQPS
jgi:hypothetical protein